MAPPFWVWDSKTPPRYNNIKNGKQISFAKNHPQGERAKQCEKGAPNTNKSAAGIPYWGNPGSAFLLFNPGRGKPLPDDFSDYWKKR